MQIYALRFFELFRKYLTCPICGYMIRDGGKCSRCEMSKKTENLLFMIIFFIITYFIFSLTVALLIYGNNAHCFRVSCIE